MHCSEHSMQAVEPAVPCIAQGDRNYREASTNGAGKEDVVGTSAREILLGLNAQNSNMGQEMFPAGMPSTADDLSFKNKGLLCKASNVIIDGAQYSCLECGKRDSFFVDC
jgi:hypothetical protein